MDDEAEEEAAQRVALLRTFSRAQDCAAKDEVGLCSVERMNGLSRWACVENDKAEEVFAQHVIKGATRVDS